MNYCNCTALTIYLLDCLKSIICLNRSNPSNASLITLNAARLYFPPKKSSNDFSLYSMQCIFDYYRMILLELVLYALYMPMKVLEKTKFF